MLYDLGKMGVFDKGFRFIKIFSLMITLFVFLCVLLSIAVRIGDLIIGF